MSHTQAVKRKFVPPQGFLPTCPICCDEIHDPLKICQNNFCEHGVVCSSCTARLMATQYKATANPEAKVGQSVVKSASPVSCPGCRRPVTAVAPCDRLVYNMLEKMLPDATKPTCGHGDCTFTGSLMDVVWHRFDKHTKMCVHCPNCGKSVQEDDLQTHVDTDCTRLRCRDFTCSDSTTVYTSAELIDHSQIHRHIGDVMRSTRRNMHQVMTRISEAIFGAERNDVRMFRLCAHLSHVASNWEDDDFWSSGRLSSLPSNEYIISHAVAEQLSADQSSGPGHSHALPIHLDQEDDGEETDDEHV